MSTPGTTTPPNPIEANAQEEEQEEQEELDIAGYTQEERAAWTPEQRETLNLLTDEEYVGMASMTNEERVEIMAQHEEFSRAARLFDQPADIYEIELIRWWNEVRERNEKAERELAQLPPPSQPVPTSTNDKNDKNDKNDNTDDIQPTDEASIPIIERVRNELQDTIETTNTLVTLIRHISDVYARVRQASTMEHVAFIQRYIIATPLFANTLLRNPDHEPVRMHARWILQSVKNLAYLTIEGEIAATLPKKCKKSGKSKKSKKSKKSENDRETEKSEKSEKSEKDE